MGRQTNLLTVVGVDIGQKVDPTAIAVVGIDRRPLAPSLERPAKLEFHFVVRFLDRLPLGTPYPGVCQRIGAICRGIENRSGKRPFLYVDATGVGKPIVDMLKDSSSATAGAWAVYFTRGDQRKERRKKKEVSLGKAYLVSRLQSLLQTGRIHLPNKNPEAHALAQELLDYEIRVDENANDKYGAFRVGTHDDLVTALGLAVQVDPRVSVYPGKEYFSL